MSSTDSWHDINDHDIELRKYWRSLNRRKGAQARVVPHVIISGIEHKSCAKCASLKPVTEFYAHTGTSDHLQGYCKSCGTECRKEKKK